MKVYVDELPSCCEDCPFFDLEDGYCSQQEMHLDFEFRKDTGIDIDCPLQSLADYTKQVRKEVIDKVYEVHEQAIPHDLCWSWAVIEKELNQIQGENNGNTNNN